MSTPHRTPSVGPTQGIRARELSFRLEQESKPQRFVPTNKAWKLYFTQEVAFDWFLLVQMYFLTFGTGLLDATTYSAYRVFATKMTGNLLLLAVDAIDHTSISTALEQNVATAIGAFIIGAVAFGHIGRLIGRRRRLYLVVNNLLQTALVFGATAIQYWGLQAEVGYHAVIKMFLLAFAMAGQVSLAIGVGLAEINTTMITAALIQLCWDPEIFRLKNRSRDRKLAFLVTIAAGHFAGAAASRRSVALGFLLTACMKTIVTVSFLFNPGMVMVQTAQDVEKNDKMTGAVTPVVQVLWGD